MAPASTELPPATCAPTPNPPRHSPTAALHPPTDKPIVECEVVGGSTAKIPATTSHSTNVDAGGGVRG